MQTHQIIPHLITASQLEKRKVALRSAPHYLHYNITLIIKSWFYVIIWMAFRITYYCPAKCKDLLYLKPHRVKIKLLLLRHSISTACNTKISCCCSSSGKNEDPHTALWYLFACGEQTISGNCLYCWRVEVKWFNLCLCVWRMRNEFQTTAKIVGSAR